jgi:hypothetical protein
MVPARFRIAVKKLQKFLLCVLLYSVTGDSQTPPGKGKEIIDKSVAALGGDRFVQMKNRVASGRIYSFFHDELSGLDVATIYTEYLGQTRSNGVALREREVLGKKQDYSYLFLEDQGWDITYRGARPIPDENWDRYARTTRNDILYFLRQRRNEPGLEFDYIGTDVYLSTHVEIVDIIDATNQVIRIYFDHNTLFPVRESYTWMNPETRERNEEITNFDKYRDAGGVMWPFTIERQRNGYKVYQMFASKVEVNQALPPGIFELPPGARTLKKVN